MIFKRTVSVEAVKVKNDNGCFNSLLKLMGVVSVNLCYEHRSESPKISITLNDKKILRLKENDVVYCEDGIIKVSDPRKFGRMFKKSLD